MDASSSDRAQPSVAATKLQEQRTCPEHGDYTAMTVEGEMAGRPFRMPWSVCPACKAAEKAKRVETELAQRRAAFERHARIPRRYAGKSLAAWTATTPEQSKALAVARAYVDGFSAIDNGADVVLQRRGIDGHGLLLLGRPGTGKTLMACAILEELQDHWGQYWVGQDIIRVVRDTWRRGRRDEDRPEALQDLPTTEVGLLDHFARLELLVVDDLGAASYGSESERAILFDILDSRYREMRPTIVISNMDLTGLRAEIGDRAFSRLAGVSRVLPCTWASHRSAEGWSK